MRRLRPAAAAERRAYFPALTGLRAFAAAGVFIHHYCRHWHRAPGRIADFLESGSLGVSVFFALSGFLITWTYLPRILAEGKLDFRHYWIKRAARILPVYWVILAVVLVFQKPTGQSVSATIADITLTQPIWGFTIWSGIFTAWSLTSEEIFYLLAPALLAWIAASWPPHKAAARKALYRPALLLAGVCVAFYGAGKIVELSNPSGDFLSFPPYIFHFNIFGRFAEFAIGMLTALAAMRAPRTKSRRTDWLPEAGTLAFLAVTALSMYLWKVLEKDIAPRRELWPIESCLIFWLTGAGTSFFLWSSARGSRLADALFGNRIMVYLGRISFCLYLLQNSIFIDNVSGALTRLGLDPANPLALYLGLSCVAAFFYHAVETPLHAFVLKRAVRGPGSFARKASPRRPARKAA